MFFKSGDRRQIALDLASSNLMIADEDLKITYLNNTLRTFFKDRKERIEASAPGFDVEGLVGTSLEALRAELAQQRRASASGPARHESTIWIGDTEFDLSAQSILDRRGRHLGTVIEWYDTDIRRRQVNDRAVVAAIMRAQAVIRFDTHGIVQEANDKFLDATGYTREDVIGQHHRMFVYPEDTRTEDYEAFWRNLRSGIFQGGEYRRRTKQGETLWLNATYNPLLDESGETRGVVKFAYDITDEKRRQSERLQAQEVIARDLTRVASNVSQASHQATDASASSETASTSVQSGSVAIEELSASVAEIERQVVHASTIATEAVDQAERTNSIVSTLTDAAKEIESVVGLISAIAEQTNLLALNATIEAARAGDAGRGFAVVAAEVKDLANQTGQATEEITSRIANVQKTSVDAVDAIAEISGTIAKISEISSAISSAVEQQAATTTELSGSMQTTARDVQSIDGLIRGIAGALESIDETTQKVKTAATALG